jgi:hypothetical protein
MIILKVPYAEKDRAKALGARWNNERKVWYVPEGHPSAPFEEWMTSPLAASLAGDTAVRKVSKPKIDSYSGTPVVGEHYVELEHDCNPFVECAQCLPFLLQSGWKAAHDAAAQALVTICQDPLR